MSKIKICCIFLLFCCILLGSISFAARTHTHNYTILLSRVEPTCVEDGYVEYKCEYAGCKSTEKSVLPQLGHDYEVKIYQPNCEDSRNESLYLF